MRKKGTPLLSNAAPKGYGACQLATDVPLDLSKFSHILDYVEQLSGYPKHDLEYHFSSDVTEYKYQGTLGSRIECFLETVEIIQELLDSDPNYTALYREMMKRNVLTSEKDAFVVLRLYILLEGYSLVSRLSEIRKDKPTRETYKALKETIKKVSGILVHSYPISHPHPSDLDSKYASALDFNLVELRGRLHEVLDEKNKIYKEYRKVIDEIDNLVEALMWAQPVRYMLPEEYDSVDTDDVALREQRKKLEAHEKKEHQLFSELASLSHAAEKLRHRICLAEVSRKRLSNLLLMYVQSAYQCFNRRTWNQAALDLVQKQYLRVIELYIPGCIQDVSSEILFYYFKIKYRLREELFSILKTLNPSWASEKYILFLSVALRAVVVDMPSAEQVLREYIDLAVAIDNPPRRLFGWRELYNSISEIEFGESPNLYVSPYLNNPKMPLYWELRYLFRQPALLHGDNEIIIDRSVLYPLTWELACDLSKPENREAANVAACCHEEESSIVARERPKKPSLARALKSSIWNSRRDEEGVIEEEYGLDPETGLDRAIMETAF